MELKHDMLKLLTFAGAVLVTIFIGERMIKALQDVMASPTITTPDLDAGVLTVCVKPIETIAMRVPGAFFKEGH